MPKVSVAIPTYNCARYIARSIESVLGQTWTDFELVISDNASTDGTADICREFAVRDSRVRYIRRDINIGGPGNFRYVFSQCNGEYHKWTTADDFLDATYLARAIAVLDAQPEVVLCYSKTQLINAVDERISDYEDNLDLREESAAVRFRRLLEEVGLCNAHLGVIRRAAMQKTHLIGKELASDVHFLAELTLQGQFVLLPEQLFFRRFHEQSSSWNRTDKAHQKKYYDPSGNGSSRMDTWVKYRKLVKSVWCSGIPLTEKMALTAWLCRRASWNRGELIRELRGPFTGR